MSFKTRDIVLIEQVLLARGINDIYLMKYGGESKVIFLFLLRGKVFNRSNHSLDVLSKHYSVEFRKILLSATLTK